MAACSKCGSIMEDGMFFCSKCGTKMTEALHPEVQNGNEIELYRVYAFYYKNRSINGILLVTNKKIVLHL